MVVVFTPNGRSFLISFWSTCYLSKVLYQHTYKIYLQAGWTGDLIEIHFSAVRSIVLLKYWP